MTTSDHEELGAVGPGRTMQLDALPDELIDGLEGDDGGYELAGPSAPPPLPPRGSGPPAGSIPPAGSMPPGSMPPPEASKRTMVLAIVVAVVMAVAGIVVGTMMLGGEEAEPEAPPVIELGDIEVESH